MKVKYESHVHRPRTLICEDKLTDVDALIRDNLRIIVRDITEKLLINVGMWKH